MKPKKPKPKKALLYARVANLDQSQKPNRLMHQINELQIYCQNKNIEVEGIYYEKASGFNFDRLEFQYLIYDIKMKNVKADLLLFTQWERFSRNPSESKKMIKKLKEMGVKAKAMNDHLFYCYKG